MAIHDHFGGGVSFGGGVVLRQPCFHSSLYTLCLPRHAQSNDPPHWEPIKYNQKFYEGEFLSKFDVIRSEEKDRVSVIDALKTKKYGDFSAIYSPHFQTGGEMGQWDAELIPLPPSVRIFASAGAGFNWADTDLLGQHKIWYANGAGASDEAVSDTAFYMIVSVFCSFTRSQLPTRTTVLEIFNATHKLIASISHNPRGYILGIIGLGGISKKLAYKARTALGMEIHCFDVVRASVDEEHRLGATFHASLDKLLKVADCISLHTPLNAYTQDLIDARALALMKAGSKVVNTARGQVVNEDALVAALKSGPISAAGLDVYYHESQVAPELAEMENFTLTAHIGRGALDTRINFEPNAMKNILAVVGPEGEFIGEPLTPVNAKAFNAP